MAILLTKRIGKFYIMKKEGSYHQSERGTCICFNDISYQCKHLLDLKIFLIMFNSDIYYLFQSVTIFFLTRRTGVSRHSRLKIAILAWICPRHKPQVCMEVKQEHFA